MELDQVTSQIYFESVYLNEGMLSKPTVANAISQPMHVNQTIVLYILKIIQ